MTGTGDAEGRADVEDEYRFVRWVKDPSGVLHCVQGVKWLGVAGPAFLRSDGGGRLVQGVLGFLNKGVTRVQRPHSLDGCHLEVFRVVGDRHELIRDDEVDDWEEGRRQAVSLVAEIKAGRFEARDVDG